MNDEIKKILDMFTKYKDDWYSCEYKLKPKQCVAVLDYITNLQQENEHFRTELNTYKNAVYKIRNYINAYSPYFLQTQEENNQTIAKIIHEELDGGDEE